MIVYHVCSLKKLKKYEKTGRILAPVRAWENIQQAERMSLSTSRRIILRLKFPDNATKLAGHFNEARVLHDDLPFNGIYPRGGGRDETNQTIPEAQIHAGRA